MSDRPGAFFLLVVSGPTVGQRLPITGARPLTVGRAPEADCSLPNDGEMSALHFSVELAQGGCKLRDLGSRNGTKVNRERVREAMLREGDEIRAGSTAFAVTWAPSPAPSAERGGPPPGTPTIRAMPRVTLPPGHARQPDARRATPWRGILAAAPFAAAAQRRLRELPGPLFTVLDAARDPRIGRLLRVAGQQVASLHAGPQAALLADVGPVLAALQPSSQLLDRLLEGGWGKGWGVFLTSSRPFDELRKHLRRVLHETQEGKQLYFRFYDPRVLRGFLPARSPRQAQEIFEGIDAFALEADEASTLLRFTLQDGKVIRDDIPLADEG